MGKSSHSDVLGVMCRKALIAKVEKRAEALSISKSKYAALILEKWEADGEKPVSKADRALFVLDGAFPENETVEQPPALPRFGKTESKTQMRQRVKTTIRQNKTNRTDQ